MAVNDLSITADSCNVFALDGNKLVASSEARHLDFELLRGATGKFCAVTLGGWAVVDGLELPIDNSFEVEVGNVNEPCRPLVVVGMLLEGCAVGTVVGSLHLQDPDVGQVRESFMILFPCMCKGFFLEL